MVRSEEDESVKEGVRLLRVLNKREKVFKGGNWSLMTENACCSNVWLIHSKIHFTEMVGAEAMLEYVEE